MYVFLLKGRVVVIAECWFQKLWKACGINIKEFYFCMPFIDRGDLKMQYPFKTSDSLGFQNHKLEQHSFQDEQCQSRHNVDYSPRIPMPDSVTLWTNYFCLWHCHKFLLDYIPTLLIHVVDWKLTQVLGNRHTVLYIHSLFRLISVILSSNSISLSSSFSIQFSHYSHFISQLSHSLFPPKSITEEFKWVLLSGTRLWFFQAWKHPSVSFSYSCPTDAVLNENEKQKGCPIKKTQTNVIKDNT